MVEVTSKGDDAISVDVGVGVINGKAIDDVNSDGGESVDNVDVNPIVPEIAGFENSVECVVVKDDNMIAVENDEVGEL